MHRVDPVVLTDVLVAHGKYNGLRYPQWVKHQWMIDASIEIIGEQGEQWGAFDVRVVLPRRYPEGLPALYELSGRIKADADWHINEDGSCCIGPSAGEMRKYRGRATLLDWLDRSVAPFLANHLYKERFGQYRNGEYSHGIQGIIEYYQEFWATDMAGVIDQLRLVTGADRAHEKQACFCGSGDRYGQCHAHKRDFAELPREFYKKDLALLELYVAHLSKGAEVA